MLALMSTTGEQNSNTLLAKYSLYPLCGYRVQSSDTLSALSFNVCYYFHYMYFDN